MENRQARKISSAGIMAWKDQKRKLHFRVSGYQALEESRKQLTTRMSKRRNAKRRNTLIRLHFRVSDTRRLRSQESRLFNTGVPKLRNANPEIPK
jgi:hypothetical protein